MFCCWFSRKLHRAIKAAYNKYNAFLWLDWNLRYSEKHIQITGQSASDIIKEWISRNKPLMVSRFWSSELNFLLNYHLIQKSLLGNIWNVMQGFPYFLKMGANITKNLQLFSWFFFQNNDINTQKDEIKKFYDLYLNDLKEIDILWSWLNYEHIFYPIIGEHIRVGLNDLPPWHHSSPWSSSLEGKRVLIIHPFVESIKKQYEKRKFLFSDKNILPDFQLITIKSVQSIAGEKTQYKNWFEALESMKKQTNSIDFDIAIIGCGAYWMPLAAHIKRMGKQSIHLGWATQILFGILWDRWEKKYNYSNLVNKYWTRPTSKETPRNAKIIENACYW